MPTATTLPRFSREYVNLSDLFDALLLTDDEREQMEESLGNFYTWGDAYATLASVEGVTYWISLTLPDHLPNAVTLLNGVRFVNLETY